MSSDALRVRARRFDVVVAGSGPAGAVTALVLARAGATVLLADAARFPRDKACGDVVGPRGVALLRQLGVLPAEAVPVGDVVLVGPTWRGVRLPWPGGKTYPSDALVVRRERLDDVLHTAALSAGAAYRAARLADVIPEPDEARVRLSDGSRVRASFVIGADGALSRVASAVGLLRPHRALWGFALRGYVAGAVSAPHIVFWAPDGRRPVPGYGWVFPAGQNQVNVGLGLGLRESRKRAALAGRLLPAFVLALEARGLLPPGTCLESRRGGWLRMGLSGCVPASGRVLLVGDAAGLVNPLQGEGISEAMASGRAAANAIVERPRSAADAYRHALAHAFGGFQAEAGAAHEAFVARPHLRRLAANALPASVTRRGTAPGLAIWWNDLLEGARPGPARRRALGLAAVVRLATRTNHRRNQVLDGLVGDDDGRGRGRHPERQDDDAPEVGASRAARIVDYSP